MPTGNNSREQKHGPKAEAAMRAVVDGAAKVFDRVGYRNAVVSALSEESGVSQGLMYHYFASKEQIALAVIHEHQRRWLPLLATDTVSSPVEKLVQATILQIDQLQHDAVARAGLRMSFEPGTRRACSFDMQSRAGRSFQPSPRRH
jgi:AcrR family transcriptional regulator